MLLGFLTVVMMAALGYAFMAEGMFTAFVMCCNVLASGLVTFAFWEPLADLLGSSVQSTALAGYEDFVVMSALFCLTLAVLRTITNNLASTRIEFHEVLQVAGGIFFGMITGYLTAGFLVCLLQTIPWYDDFMSFRARFDRVNDSALRRLLPPDRVWLGLMQRAAEVAFASGDESSFDPNGTFEMRYARYRRYPAERAPLPYYSEFDEELRRGSFARHGP
jgi:hypothetical protein